MKRIIVILFLIFFCYAVKAQISTEEIPYSWGRGSEEIIKQSIPLETLPYLDMEAINQEDLENEDFGDIPVRFGFSHDVNLDLSNSGVWQTTIEPNTTVRIHAQDIVILNPNFYAEAGSIVTITAGGQTQASKSSHISSPSGNDNTKSFSSLGKRTVESIETADSDFFTIYPNPTHSHFTIDYTLNGATPVLLEFYTVSGIKVKTFLDTNQETGQYHCEFSTSDLNAGIYIYSFKTALETYSGKIIIQK